MFKPSPRVVAIDDNPDHLERIVQAVRAVGWPCQELLYDGGFDDDLKLPKEGIRLVFLDIHLAAGGEAGDGAAKSGVLADALGKAISNGPFAIIFWTEFPEEAQTMMDFLRDRRRNPNLPLPLLFSCLDKKKVLSQEGSDQEALKEVMDVLEGVVAKTADKSQDSGKMEPQEKIKILEDAFGNAVELLAKSRKVAIQKAMTVLEEAVATAIEEVNILRPMLMWESRIHTAAARTLDRLAHMAMPRLELSQQPPTDKASPGEQPSHISLEEYKGNLAGLLKTIAKEVDPENERTGHAWRAYGRGLLPLLEDHLLNDESPGELQAAWNVVQGMGGGVPGNTAALLNSYFLVDANIDGQSCSARGMFCPLLLEQGDWVAVYNQPIEAIHGEFFFLEKPKVKDRERLDAIGSCRFGVVTLGASCDHAQDKSPFSPRVLSMLIPERYVSYVSKQGKIGMHDGFFGYHPFVLGGEAWRIAFNFRYIRGFACSDPVLDKPLLRLRRQIVDEVCFQSAMFQARPGVIAFR